MPRRFGNLFQKLGQIFLVIFVIFDRSLCMKGENLLLELLPNARSNGHVPDLTFRPVVDSFKPSILHLDSHGKVRT